MSWEAWGTPDYLDDDDRPTCEKCGEPLTADEDGDGVMTAPVYFCEHCPDDDTLHGEQEVKGGGS